MPQLPIPLLLLLLLLFLLLLHIHNWPLSPTHTPPTHPLPNPNPNSNPNPNRTSHAHAPAHAPAHAHTHPAHFSSPGLRPKPHRLPMAADMVFSSDSRIREVLHMEVMIDRYMIVVLFFGDRIGMMMVVVVV